MIHLYELWKILEPDQFLGDDALDRALRQLCDLYVWIKGLVRKSRVISDSDLVGEYPHLQCQIGDLTSKRLLVRSDFRKVRFRRAEIRLDFVASILAF